MAGCKVLIMEILLFSFFTGSFPNLLEKLIYSSSSVEASSFVQIPLSTKTLE